ncbi:MAG: aminoglycoside phosphotransferase family protein [Chloroflexota bacterium]|nr:aminoglycoside phosphotransferase family protein [Chloroflexota bacterium]
MSDLPYNLEALLSHLTSEKPAGEKEDEPEHEWQGWLIKPVGGFHTHPVFHARCHESALAVKFVASGSRDGAGREYESLLVLQKAGLDIAPEPLLLDRDSYTSPVVVTTWLDGEVRDEPLQSDEEWLLLARHLALVSSIRPESGYGSLRPSVVFLRSAEEARSRFEMQLSTIPPDALPTEVNELARRVRKLDLPEWTAPRLSLIRCDPNILNFIRRPGAWGSVDWADSGWGDPAADMGDLMAHPAYISVPGTRWEWLADEYAALLGDANAPTRIGVYYRLTVAWWVASLATRLHRLSMGQSTGRYVGRPADWEGYLKSRYAQYIARARELLA